MTATAKEAGRGERPSARERLLAAANELFYREGVQSVGIDRVIEHAGVAKASLYNCFGSKEGLVQAYLESRHERNSARILRVMPRYGTARERLLGIFDAQDESFHDPEFNGCAFVAASAEAPHGGAVEQASDAYRGWLRGLFTSLAAEAGAPDPETLGRQLHLLYDGSTLSARMDRDRTAAAAARAAAAALLDAVLPPEPADAAPEPAPGPADAAPGRAPATPGPVAARRA
jgi:AcrR family transcriptional regulator